MEMYSGIFHDRKGRYGQSRGRENVGIVMTAEKLIPESISLMQDNPEMDDLGKHYYRKYHNTANSSKHFLSGSVGTVDLGKIAKMVAKPRYSSDRPVRPTDEVHGMSDFLDVCKRQLRNFNSEARPSLSSLLIHPFFSHEFLTTYNFLIDLPIKKENEKQDFFRGLADQLSLFPAPTVASQLGSLLLSRLVLLDSTAQVSLLPHLFTPKKDGSDCGLFSESVFRTHMVPRLLPLFCVRDVQIRLILLKHFSSYCTLFSKIQLQTRILPELLVGIKDTNDTLVSCTLRALAELVPELGGEVVIGGKRAKLFADGRPKAVKSVLRQQSKRMSKPDPTIDAEDELPERPSPVGGEHTPLSSEDDEAWPDWEDRTVSSAESGAKASVNSKEAQEEDSVVLQDKNRTVNNIESGIQTLELKLKPKVSDVFEDIFRDMEPVISKPSIAHIKQEVTTDKFALSSEVCEDVDGWGEDFDSWNDDEVEPSCKTTSANS